MLHPEQLAFLKVEHPRIGFPGRPPDMDLFHCVPVFEIYLFNVEPNTVQLVLFDTERRVPR